MVTLPGFVTQKASLFQIARFEIFETNASESKELTAVNTMVSSYTKMFFPSLNWLIMVTLPGFEPGIPPWKGGVLTAWP